MLPLTPGRSSPNRTMTRLFRSLLIARFLACSLAFGAGTAWAADPTTADCLSSNDSSIDLRNQHKLRAARAELLICAGATCPEDIRNECARRVSEVNASMPTIVFEAKDSAGNDLSSVKVTMDGQPLVERLQGTALSIDPGEHVFVFTVEGSAAVQRTFVIQEGEKGRRERILLGGPGAAPALVPAPGTAPPGAGAPAPGVAMDTNSTARTTGYIVGAVGVGALGLAVFEQLTALSRDNKSNSAAASPNPAVRATASQLHSQATTAQTYALVASGIGIAAVGTGLFLIFTNSGDGTPKPSAVRLVPTVGLGGGGLLLERAW